MRSSTTHGKSRGRVETRTLTATPRGVDECAWPDLAQFPWLARTTVVDGRTRTSVGYAVTSLSPDRASPERLLDPWRGRWEIENRTFWVLDVVLREDDSRIWTR